MAFDPNQTTRIQRAIKMEHVPPERWPRVLQRTVTGAVLVAFGIAGAALWSFPWYVAAGSVGLGATVWSTKMVTNALRALLEPVKAYKRALAKDEEPTDG